jgi:hypothetical protein
MVEVVAGQVEVVRRRRREGLSEAAVERLDAFPKGQASLTVARLP